MSSASPTIIGPRRPARRPQIADFARPNSQPGSHRADEAFCEATSNARLEPGTKRNSAANWLFPSGWSHRSNSDQTRPHGARYPLEPFGFETDFGCRFGNPGKYRDRRRVSWRCDNDGCNPSAIARLPESGGTPMAFSKKISGSEQVSEPVDRSPSLLTETLGSFSVTPLQSTRLNPRVGPKRS